MIKEKTYTSEVLPILIHGYLYGPIDHDCTCYSSSAISISKLVGLLSIDATLWGRRSIIGSAKLQM